MTRRQSTFERDTVTDDQDLTPLVVVETRDLWNLQVKSEEADMWLDYGSHREDWKDVLRSYNFRKERYPEEPIRMLHTEVTTRVADPDWLNLKMKEEKTAASEDTAVSSD